MTRFCTDIIEFDKKRAKVYLDDQFSFLLYKGEIKDLNIRPGEEISDEVYNEIIQVILPKRCRLRAMNLLQKRDYTTRQLREKLEEGLYPDDIVGDAIEYVSSYRYLDDERFARDYISYHMSVRSQKRIIQDLCIKGIDKELVKKLIEEQYSEETQDPEQDQIRKLLDKKHFSGDMEAKEVQKVLAFLLRRGYSMDSIKKVMKEYD